jgi:mannose-6-phosphate isomerase-like protein (cupin superfamily)/predicted enzyme related to lactoylglutathione lyase
MRPPLRRSYSKQHMREREDMMSATVMNQTYTKLPARDVERARAFYADKLDLMPFGEHNNNLYYELGGSHFMVYPSGGAASGAHDQLGFVVEDLESMVVKLRSNGVIFEEYEPPPGVAATDEIMDFGGVKSAWFKDSEGNLLSIVEFAGGSPFAASPESGVHSRQRNGSAVAGRAGGEQGEAGTEKEAVGIYPNGGRSIWLLGMLITFKAVSEETGGEYSLYELTVPPQHGAPPHIHHRETEAFYVLDGQVEFLRGEHTVRVRVGEFVFVPRGVVHGFTNVGREPARFMGIVTPGGLHEKLLSGLGEPAKAETLPPPPEGSPDAERFAATMREYDSELLPLPGQ